MILNVNDEIPQEDFFSSHRFFSDDVFMLLLTSLYFPLLLVMTRGNIILL